MYKGKFVFATNFHTIPITNIVATFYSGFEGDRKQSIGIQEGGRKESGLHVCIIMMRLAK